MLAVARIMVAFALTVVVVDVGLYFTGTWSYILGAAGNLEGASAAATVCVGMFAISIPLGIWGRVLLGLGKNHVLILLQGLQAPLTLLFVFLILRGPSGHLLTSSFLSIGVYLAVVVVASVGFFTANRLTANLLKDTFRDALKLKSAPGARVMHVGLPMLVQTLTPPITTQVTRFIVAQSAGVYEMSQYGLLTQILLPGLGLISAAGMTLWPYYAKAKSTGDSVRSPFKLAKIFAAGGLIALIGWVVASPLLMTLMSDGSVSVAFSVVAIFGAQLVAQAAVYPLGMYLMDSRGIQFQVAPALLLCLFSLAFTAILAPQVGIVAAPLSAALGVILFQVVPFSWYIRRRRLRGE